MSVADMYNQTAFNAGRITWPMLTEVVRAYQAAHGLDADGKLGPKTAAVLQQVLSFHEPGDPVLAWKPDLDAASAALGRPAGIDPAVWDQFLLDWVRTESGGNPCSEGIIDHDGFHVEAGIGQVYFDRDKGANPVAFKTTSATLRSGCSGKSVFDPSAVNRQAQAESLVRMALDAYVHATSALERLALVWSARDHLRLTKMVHALPAVLETLTNSDATFAELEASVAPRSAGYFLHWIPALAPFAGDPMRRVFANCWWTVPLLDSEKPVAAPSP